MTWSFDAYQRFCRTTAIYPKDASVIYPALGLASEAGEVLGKIKKKIRDGVENNEATIDELGDVLWYVAVLADDLGVSLSQVVVRNTDKLIDRADRNVLSGNGDNR